MTQMLITTHQSRFICQEKYYSRKGNLSMQFILKNTIIIWTLRIDKNQRKMIFRIPLKGAQHQVGKLYGNAFKSSDQ